MKPAGLMNEARVFLLCSKVNDERQTPPEGDFDVEVTCRCGERLLKRNSAPTHAVALCCRCWERDLIDG